jgi:tripartite-type tricarboxylate transporter receptor subunit TctC
VEMRHVRYDKTERLYEDLEAGRISLSFNNMMSMLPRCREGALRALAVTSATRASTAPDLPALGEKALPGYEMSNWLGIVAPKATPRATVEKLSAAAGAALRHPIIRSSFAAAGVTPCGGTSVEFAAFMREEIARWGPVVARFRDLEA